MKQSLKNLGLGPALGLGLALAILASSAKAAAFDDVVVFGDSLSDVGNDYILTKKKEPASPPYHDGRFSDGPLWVEAVAAAYGLTLKPSVSGGTDYAYGGAETIANLSSSYGTIPSLYTQAVAYLKAVHGKADPHALYVVWGGSNDLLNTLDGNIADLPSLPNRFAKATKKIIDTLHKAGAKSFIVPQIPDVGDSPLAQAAGSIVAGAASDAATAMNAALAVVLLQEQTQGLSIYHLQDFGLQDQLTNAVALGHGSGQSYFNLSNASKACLNGTKVCADQYQYFFWDSLHPTATVHAMLAVAALTALPH